jgi:hypothetical protein
MPTYRVSAAEAAERFRQMQMDVPKSMKAVARMICIGVQREALRNLNNGFLDRKTGTLMRYVSANLRPVAVSDGWAIGLPKGDLEAKIGRVHETGATIKAKNGKFLRIPIPGGPAGKNDPYAGMSIRGVPGFFIAKSKQGNPIIFKVGSFDFSKKGSAFEPWYFLKQSVTLPSRPWFSAACATAIGEAPGLIAQQIAKAIEGRGVQE